MTINLTATPSPAPNVMAIPAPGESVTSASVALYAQVLLDASRWARLQLEPLVIGGSGITPIDNVYYNQNAASGLYIEINKTKHYANGVVEVNNELVVKGVARFLRRTQEGAAGGTSSYTPDGRLVYFNGSGMGATYWRIDDPSDTAPFGSWVEFYNASNPVPIQSPGGGALGSIGTGQSMKCTKVASNTWIAQKTSP